MEENEARDLVFINVKNAGYLQPTKDWISVCKCVNNALYIVSP